MVMKQYRVMIVDDHPLMRRGIKQLLGLDARFSVVAEAGNGSEAVALALQHTPDVILLDLNMKGMSGLDTLRALRDEGVDARIIVLTVSDARSDLYALIDTGARAGDIGNRRASKNASGNTGTPMATNTARQPSQLLSVMPTGTPSTSDPLIPMKMMPMARPCLPGGARSVANMVASRMTVAQLAAITMRSTKRAA